MTPARHNIVHFARTHGIDINVQCFANGTLAVIGDRAVMFDNHASYDDVVVGLGGRQQKRVPRDDVKPSAETMRKFHAMAAATIIHELSMTKGIDLVLHPDGRVTWMQQR